MFTISDLLFMTCVGFAASVSLQVKSRMPYNWITVTTYPTCISLHVPTGWAVYACNVCSQTIGINNSYSMLSCSNFTNENMNYSWANYSTQDCLNTSMIFSYADKMLPLTSCVTRSSVGNPFKFDSFISISSEFDYAVYDLVSGSNPPSTPVPGNLKRYVNIILIY